MASGVDFTSGRRARRSQGRPWLIAGLAFAAAATALLVLTDDTRWLRLGIVCALWAALLGAFVAAYFRRQADRSAESITQAQRVYELELEREVAARREFELDLQVRQRGAVDDRSRSDLEALKSEIVALRNQLQQLIGAEVTYERFALTAQATRMRALHDGDAEVSRQFPARTAASNPPQLPAAGIAGNGSGPLHNDLAGQRTELITRVLGMERRSVERESRNGSGHGNGNGHAERPGYSLFTPARQTAPAPVPPAPVPPAPVPPAPVEPVSVAPRVPREDPVKSDLSAILGEDFGFDWSPSWESAEDPAPAEPQRSAPASAFGGHEDPADAVVAPPVNSTLPAAAREIQRSGQPGGRRRKPEPEYVEYVEAPSGRHASRAVEAVVEPPPEPRGSHAQGKSVTELLASYGAAAEPRRRRREP